MITSSKVPTDAMKVTIITEDYEIKGFMHVRAGSYQARVSDLLNIKELHYLPITDASYRKLNQPDAPVQKTQTLIIRLDTIKMVVPEDEVMPAAADLQAGGYTTNIASPKL